MLYYRSFNFKKVRRDNNLERTLALTRPQSEHIPPDRDFKNLANLFYPIFLTL